MIRPFSLSDLSRLLEIEHQSFPKSPYDAVTLINLYWLHKDTFLVYVEKGEIQGYIVFSKEGHIISIAVHPERRRKGIGRGLIKRAMNLPGVKKVTAEVRRSNKGAQAFYLHMGFRTVRVVPKYYGDEDALIVEWNPFGP